MERGKDAGNTASGVEMPVSNNKKDEGESKYLKENAQELSEKESGKRSGMPVYDKEEPWVKKYMEESGEEPGFF